MGSPSLTQVAIDNQLCKPLCVCVCARARVCVCVVFSILMNTATYLVMYCVHTTNPALMFTPFLTLLSRPTPDHTLCFPLSPSCPSQREAATPPSLCSPLNSSSAHKALLTKSEGCTFYSQALTAQQAGTDLLVIAYNESSLKGLVRGGRRRRRRRRRRRVGCLMVYMSRPFVFFPVDCLW